jgi:thiol-disulfide isomerase/thioredoxin
MKRIIVISMIGMILFVGNLYAQRINHLAKFTDVILSGKVTDSSIKKRKDGKTTVYVKISKYPFSESGINATKGTKYEVVVKYNETFNIRIPSPANSFYMCINYYKNEVLYWSDQDNIYLLNQGDSINADLGSSYFKFSGRGSDKLNCESEIYNASFRGWSFGTEVQDKIVSLLNHGEYKEYFTLIEGGRDSCFLIQKAILEKYKKSLGKELSDIMLANCYGIRYYSTLRGARQGSDDNPVFYRAVINSPEYKKMDLSLTVKIDPNILMQAPMYADFLFEKIRMDNSLEADGTRQMALYYKRQFNDIKQKYQGIIRDKLLALFFITNSKFATGMDSLNVALKLCGPSIYKEILINLRETQSTGKPFYPFELPDTKGRMVKLSDFDKKVVILDFWYTGCENCINLHHNMEPIYNKYKDNPQVVFVSVSIDKDKKQWLNSVSKGNYTHPNDINLYTNGQGNKSPLLTKYSIGAFPTVFVLKNGKMFSSGPPRPNSKSLTEGTTLEYINLIESATAYK